MSLRQKILLITGSTLLGLLIILAVMSSVIWQDSVTRLERQQAQQDLNRVITALSGEMATLDRLTNDWAGWDDTYAFIADHNSAYISSNLNDNALIQSQLNVILYIDLTGQIVYSQTFDLQRKQTVSTSPEWATYLTTLTQEGDLTHSVIGLVQLPDGPRLVAARPILTSEYTGPRRGTLIMARALSADVVQQLEKTSGLALELRSVDDPNLPADFQQAAKALFVSGVSPTESTPVGIFSQPLDEQQIAGYVLLVDVTGQPAVLLRASAPRLAWQQVQISIRYLLVFLLFTGAVFSVMTLFLIDRLLLRRVTQLETSVGHIGLSGDPTARVPAAGVDELARLAQSINTMLASLEHAQRENARLYDETRRQLGELSLLHTASMATARRTTLDEALQEIALSAFDTLNAVNAMVLLCPPGSSAIEVRAHVGVSPETLQTRHFARGQGIIGWVAEHGEPALVADVTQDPRYYLSDSRTRSELCVPLMLDERMIGVINVESDQLGGFSTSDLQLLQTLAHNLSIIIEKLRLLEELRAANERLTELDRLKNRFMANMNHELRTPLNAVLGFSELLIDGVPGPLNDDQRTYVQHIYTSGQHLLALINDVLDLSKLQAGRVELELQQVHLADIAAEAHTFILPAVQRKHQAVIIDLPAELPVLYVDVLRVRQVLINLLNNAGKFTPEAGTITVQATRVNDDWLQASVSDTGPGIPAERQGNIFEEFSQIDQKGHRELGTGLGLAIARRLIELHGGQIWIESTGLPGEGTTFHFTLPCYTPARHVAPHSAATRLLIVDDDPLIIELLQAILPPPEFEVFGTTAAEQTVERVARDKPDVLLLDLLMPGVNGFDILAALRRDPRTRETRVLVFTAKTLSATEQAEVDRLAQAVLTKNQLRREVLLAAIRQVRQMPPFTAAA
jgi:signal transduction histidine kinase/sensor domain CHASE-containing protein/ActR/RegA family two-component response regulator